MKKILCFAALLFISQIAFAQNDTTIKEKILHITIRNAVIEGELVYHTNTEKLVIIIAGSGPTDRNGNSIAGVNCNAYRLMSEELIKNGIASFRFDKRGIAKSAYKNFKEQDLSFDDYINDAISIYNYLRDSSGFKHIYFAGHSEGSLIGMIASEKTNTSGYISIAGAGRPIDQIITEQVGNQSSVLGKKVDSLFSVLKAKNKLDTVPPYLFSLFRPGIQPYMISWLRYNPCIEIKKLNCPILVVQGTCDVQIKVKDAEALHEANLKSNLVVIDGMTHVLKNAEANCSDKNLATYHNPSLPLHTKFVTDIIHFIQAN